jgi:hypothetical protein
MEVCGRESWLRVQPHGQSKTNGGWLDLEQIATVEVTSEDPNFPIESVFTSKHGPGWRATQSGAQQIRIIFDQAVSLKRIQLRFVEPNIERIQEFTLRWSSADGGPERRLCGSSGISAPEVQPSKSKITR